MALVLTLPKNTSLIRNPVRSKLRIALQDRQALVGSAILQLTELEWNVLAVLATENGKMVSYVELWRRIWHANGVFAKREKETVRGVVKRLRRKLEPDPVRPRFLITVRGIGIRLQPSHVIVM